MRIAVIRQRYVSHGGAERFSASLIQELAKSGNEVHVFTSEWKNEEYDPNIQVHIVPTKTINATIRVLSFNRAVINMLSQYRFDLVQSHERTTCQDIYRAGDGCHVEWLKSRKKHHPLKGYFVYLNPFHLVILRIEKAIFSHHKFKKVIAISEMVKKNIMDNYGLLEKDIVVIYNGVALNRFCPENKQKHREKLRKILGISDTMLTILTVGSGFERKGLKFLLLSLKYWAAKDWRLLVIGKGNWTRYKQFAPKEFRERLIYLPPPINDLEKYYAAADAFILPSIYEPFGNVYLEALATGLPVIASRFSGAAELITHKFNGMVLQNPGNPKEIAELINYLNNSSIRKAMGNQARRLAENFPIKKNTESMLKLYEKILF